MNQEWFEMADIRRRRLANAVWIPLRAEQKIESVGRYGYPGFKEEGFVAGSLAVPIDKKSEAERLVRGDIGRIWRHRSRVEGERYIPADIFEDYNGEFLGAPLVLEQPGNRQEPSQWHLHQDLVIALNLKREGDTWLCLNEGYKEVARIHRRNDESPDLLEVRAEHLKDYLCARNMALYVCSYRCRKETVDDASHIKWRDDSVSDDRGGDRWSGWISEMHEGGKSVGTSTLIIHHSRTDVDPDEDIPSFGPGEGNIDRKCWTKTAQGRKLYMIQGDLWRNEWVDPTPYSPRIRGDELPPTVSFVIDEKGTLQNKTTLKDGGRWLWFRPGVIGDFADRRGGALGWYTRDTGVVLCSADWDVHFGVNKLGLINVYAKHIAVLPEWLQRIWAGFNVSPEGGVSEELLASQAKGIPANTKAPEELLPEVIVLLDQTALKKLGFRLFRDHDDIDRLLERSHRFRSTDTFGFFSLAKDLFRLTGDSIDGSALQKIVPPPKNQNWGSLKSLENVIAAEIGAEQAHLMLGPLFGIYNLRLADAHLAGSELGDALKLVGVSQDLPFVCQGLQLLDACVATLNRIGAVLDKMVPKNYVSSGKNKVRSKAREAPDPNKDVPTRATR